VRVRIDSDDACPIARQRKLGRVEMTP
jgi:hypothetical protein